MPDLTNLSYETARDRMAALGLYIKTNSSITDTASQKISGRPWPPGPNSITARSWRSRS